MYRAMTGAIVSDKRELKYMQILGFIKIYKVAKFDTHQQKRIHNDTGSVDPVTSSS